MTSYPRPMARRAAWLTGLAVLSAACAGSGDPAGEQDAGPAAAAPLRSALIGDPAPPVAPFQLTLVAPGDAPRRLLRYRVPAGSHQRVAISVESSVDVFVAGRRINKSASPATRIAFEIAVAPRPGGGYRCTAWITDTASADWERIAPGRGSELRTSLAQLRGHQVSFEVDDRGVPGASAIALPESLESNRAEALHILKSVDGAVVPFPLEPVGVGASWTVADAEPGRSNLAGPVTLTYTLVAMRADKLDISMTIALPAEPAPLSLGGSEVAGYSGGTSGGALRFSVDLTRLMPNLAGQISSDIEGRSFSGGEELPFMAHSEARQRLEAN